MLADKPSLGSYFQPLSLEMLSLDVDRVGFEVLSRTKTGMWVVVVVVVGMSVRSGESGRSGGSVRGESEWRESTSNSRIPRRPRSMDRYFWRFC